RGNRPRPRGRRTPADAGRPSRRRVVSLARRCAGQEFPASAQQQRAASLAPLASDRDAAAELYAGVAAPGPALGRRARPQPPRPFGPAARRRTHRGAGLARDRGSTMIRLASLFWLALVLI